MKISNVIFTVNSLSNIQEIMKSHYAMTEIGGCLVGYQEDDSLVITHASGAGENAEMDYDYIVIDGEYTTAFSNTLNEKSNHRLYYLGDWHTHLSHNLNPSSRDISAIRSISRYMPTEYRETLISVIIFHYDVTSINAYCFDGKEKLNPVTWSLAPNPPWINGLLNKIEF